MEKKERDTSIELMRLIAMAMIVLHHFCIHSFNDASNYIYFIDSMSIIGVNVFVLISGFYSIRLKWESILNLLFICIFWNVFNCSIDLFYGKGQPIELIKSLMPISHPGGWFLNVYICLMIVSPILNNAFTAFTKKQDIITFVLLTIMNVYLGFFMKNSVNESGYNLVHFCYIYYIGQLIRRYELYKILSPFKWGLLYLLFSFATFLSVNWLPRFFYYNSPLIIIASVSFFALFKHIHFSHIKIINSAAKSTLPIYLATHENGMGSFFYQIAENIYTHYHSIICLFLIIILIMIIFGGIILIDQFRLFIAGKMTPVIVNHMPQNIRYCFQKGEK